MQFVGLIQATVTMRNTTGAISVPGLKVGDKLLGSWLIDLGVGNNLWRAPNTGSGGTFEASVSVDDEIQVVDNGQGTADWQIVLIRNG
jgi:hypothetical protein